MVCGAAGRFFDRFKVVARVRQLDMSGGPFLRRMLEWFNARPMLWRFFGSWGRCSRRGAAVFVSLDFCTGGRLKNSAFSEALRSGFARANVLDFAFTLEARTDAEMPERLIGGATLCRPNLGAVPHAQKAVDGRYVIPASATSPASKVLRTFIEARARGDASAAAACCAEDLVCVGPLGSTQGLRQASARLFGRASQPVDSVVRELQLVGGGPKEQLWRRAVEMRVGPGARLLVVQDYTLRHSRRDGAKISRVEVRRH